MKDPTNPGPDSAVMQRRADERAAIYEERAHFPIPATCSHCGARIWIELWPLVQKVDSPGQAHQCVVSIDNAERLIGIERFLQGCTEAAERRERERLR